MAAAWQAPRAYWASVLPGSRRVRSSASWATSTSNSQTRLGLSHAASAIVTKPWSINPVARALPRARRRNSSSRERCRSRVIRFRQVGVTSISRDDEAQIEGVEPTYRR